MKKYFVKFLPTGGEIQDGDLIQYKYYDPVSGEWAERQTTRHNAVGRLALVKNGIELTKIIPHLCSRDIQVGDMAWNERNMKNGEREVRKSEFPKSDCFEYEGENHDGRGLFKVIGEVSPDAVWITEGMGFDDGDFEYWYKLAGEWCRWVHTDPEKWKQQCIIKIKCPTCKTFH